MDIEISLKQSIKERINGLNKVYVIALLDRFLHQQQHCSENTYVQQQKSIFLHLPSYFIKRRLSGLFPTATKLFDNLGNIESKSLFKNFLPMGSIAVKTIVQIILDLFRNFR